MVAETLFFYHPAVWWTSRRIRIERELCCDDIAVQACGDAVGYAQALTRVARLLVTQPGIAVGAAGGPLLVRIQRLLGVASTPRPVSPLWVAAAAVVDDRRSACSWIRTHRAARQERWHQRSSKATPSCADA